MLLITTGFFNENKIQYFKEPLPALSMYRIIMHDRYVRRSIIWATAASIQSTLIPFDIVVIRNSRVG